MGSGFSKPVKYDRKRSEAEETFFYFCGGIFSQWYDYTFTVDGVTFNNVGQYMMYMKADIFDDQEAKSQILNSKTPAEVVHIGRHLQNFDENKWRQHSINIVKTGNTIKFVENTELREQLFATWPKILVQTGKADTIWGIGLEGNQRKIYKTKMWKGLNLLGYILTDVRDYLMDKRRVTDKWNWKEIEKYYQTDARPYNSKTTAQDLDDNSIGKDVHTNEIHRQNDEATQHVRPFEQSNGFESGVKSEHTEAINKKREAADLKYEYFWEGEDIYSQWHPSHFKIDGHIFVCTEQYMMFKKAELFGDENIKDSILKANGPRTMKTLGRKVANLDSQLWRECCVDIVKTGNMAKFKQNVHLKQQLFSTYPKILVEASPYDTIWGIGLLKHWPDARDEATWRGRNLLGYVLTGVRDELMYTEGIKQYTGKTVENVVIFFSYFNMNTHTSLSGQETCLNYIKAMVDLQRKKMEFIMNVSSV